MLRLRFAPLSMTGADASCCHAERSEASQTTSTVVYLGEDEKVDMGTGCTSRILSRTAKMLVVCAGLFLLWPWECVGW